MEENNNKKISRRSFVKQTTAVAAGTILVSGCGNIDWSEFKARNFQKLTTEEKDKLVANLEQQYLEKYGKKFNVSDMEAMDNTLFGYALDLSRCIGCRRCVYACVEENNQSRDPQIHWIQVLQMEKETGVDLNHADVHYNPDLVPQEGYFYMPIQCQQCKNPPCIKVCPAQATWSEPDGIVVVDYNWCIGCRYCMAACPYGARHFNWGEPSIPDEELNTETHYLGNRPRPMGVVEKCTFCIQRTRNGKYPACVEICPTGSRKFGNLLDPDSEVRYIIDNKRVYILKEEINTQPKFFYFFGV